MAHVELPGGGASGPDLTGAGSVFANRNFVYLWSAQTLSQLASNMVLAALMATVLRDDRIQHGRRRPPAHLPRPGRAVQHAGRRPRRAQQREGHHARHERGARGRHHRLHLRGPQHGHGQRAARVPHQLRDCDGDRGLRAGRADRHPAHRRPPEPHGRELDLRADHQRDVRHRLRLPRARSSSSPWGRSPSTSSLPACSRSARSPSCRCRRCVPTTRSARATDAAGRALHELVDQLVEGMAFVRRHRAIAWSLAYLGISSSLIGVLGAIGPGLRRRHPGAHVAELLLHHGPGRARSGGGHPVPQLVRQGASRSGSSSTSGWSRWESPSWRWRSSSRSRSSSGAPRPRSRRPCPRSRRSSASSPSSSSSPCFAGLEYAFVAIPSQTALQEELPADVRGRIFGILNTLLSVASFLPVIMAPAAADILNIFFDGAGIPIVMAFLGAVTLWAGIASWRRNARAGLHRHDQSTRSPASAVDEATSPGTPDLPEPARAAAPSQAPSPAVARWRLGPSPPPS